MISNTNIPTVPPIVEHASARLDADKRIEFNRAYAPQVEKWVNGRG
jgi:hypothetical protein